MFEKLSLNLRNLRKKRNMTQEELADILGYSSKNVSKWETGQSIPSLQTLHEICDIFHIKSIEELCSTTLPIYTLNIEQDVKTVEKYKLCYTEDEIIFYYKLQDKANNSFKIEEYDFVFKCLEKFKKDDLISSFNLSLSENLLFVEFTNNILVVAGSLSDTIIKIESSRVNFSNDYEYKNYIDSLSLSKQTLILLNYIEQYRNMSFKLADLYNDELISLYQLNYPKNNDIKKIIRTALVRLVDCNVVKKDGYSSYSKRHHKLNYNKELSNEQINYLNKKIKIDMNDAFDTKNIIFSVSDFEELKITDEELVNVLYQFMIRLRNLSIIDSFIIKINFYVELLVANNSIDINEDYFDEIKIEYV